MPKHQDGLRTISRHMMEDVEEVLTHPGHVIEELKHEYTVKKIAEDVLQDAERASLDFVDAAERMARAATPDQIEEVSSELGTVIYSMYEDTRDVMSHPNQVVMDLKSMADEGLHDVERIMAEIKEDGRRLAEDVDGAMSSLADSSEEFFCPTSKETLVKVECQVLESKAIILIS